MSVLSSANTSVQFPVRDGTINFGTPYESVTAAILSVHHCRKNEMWLARNLGRIGNFDDIVLKSDQFTFLIQVKYNNKNEIITTSNFTKYKKKEQFCLENCVGDYLILKAKIDKISQDNDIYKQLQHEEDNLKYILHTNRNVEDCNFLESVDSKFYYENRRNCGILYKFKTNELLKYANLKSIMRTEFFNNLYLYSEPILFRNTDYATMISSELKYLLTEAGCTTMNLDEKKLCECAIFYKHFFEQWEMCLLNDNATHNFCLVRDHIIAKVTQILLDGFSLKFKDIASQKLPSDCSWNSIKDVDITITDCDKRIYPLLKKYIVNRVNSNCTFETEKCKIYHKTGNSEHSRWCRWIHKLLPLVLEIQKHKDFLDIIKIMQLSDCNLSILIINNTKKDWSFLENSITNCTTSIRYLSSSKLLASNKSKVETCQVNDPHSSTNQSITNTVPEKSQSNGMIEKLSEMFNSSINIRQSINFQQAVKDKIISDEDIELRDEFGKTILHYAAWTKSSEMISQLVKMGADVNAKDLCGKTPLHCAVDADDINCLTCLLDEGAKINEVDRENAPPLLYAVKNGQIEIVELLLSAKYDANTDITDVLGRTSLYIAINRNNRDMVVSLLNKNADTELQYEGNNALHTAVTKGFIDIVRLLLEKGVKVNVANAIGKTALYLAIDCNNISIVTLLLDKKANVELKYEGTTVLHCAVTKGSREIVGLLLKKRMDVNKVDALGKTALYLAVNRKDSAMVSFLLSENASTELKCNSSTVLHQAVTRNSTEIVSLLLEKGSNVNKLDSAGRTALYLAIDCNNIEIVSLLLSNKANTELKYEGNTALHHAVITGSIEIVRLLLEKRAKINVQNNRRKTALHLACDSWPGKKCNRKVDNKAAVAHAEMYESIVALLLDKGAKVKIPDQLNNTALDYAENMKSNIGKYLGQGNMDNTDEDSENYFLLRPYILKCYETIVSLLQNKLLEIEENNAAT